MPYDEEVGTTRKKRRKKSKQKVIQTQTSPARRQRSPEPPRPPTGTLLNDQSRPPAVLVTGATPSPRAFSPDSLPGAVDDDNAWANPYPEPVPSVSEPKSSRKKPVTIEKVSVDRGANRAVTPSAVDVTSTSREKPRPKGNIFEMLPDVDQGSKNSRPG